MYYLNQNEKWILEDIQKNAKKSWANNVGFLWSSLTDKAKIAIFTLREKGIINIDAVQGKYVFCSEVLNNEN